LGQQLTAIEFLCQSLREDLRAKQPDLEPQAEKICQFLRQTIAQTRSLARGLAPVNFESGGLMEALSELARHTAALGRVECRFDCPSPVLLEDSIAAAHLFRIAQEAVNNTLKHAQAREVVIRLSQANHALRLEVCDDGRGLAKTKKPRQGMGLQVMKHRAAVIGAELEIQSTPGQGLRVTCTLPLKP
jgi:signal transduction histidine kinase